MTRIVQGELGSSFSLHTASNVTSLGFLTVWRFHNSSHVDMLPPEHKGEHCRALLVLGLKSSRMAIPFGSIGHSSHTGGSESIEDETDFIS